MTLKSSTGTPILPSKRRALSRLLITPGSRRWLDVVQRQSHIYELATTLEGYRIVQFSDLHFDGVMITRERLEALVDVINAQEPDLIAFTGDFVTNGVSFQEQDLIAALRDLKARDAKVAVMGNHDYSSAGVIERVIAESGMINLSNAVHTVKRGDTCLHIAGVGSMARLHARLDLVLNQLPEDGTAILLAHEPQFADVAAATQRFSLQLSGHLHGGQINIPPLTQLLIAGYSARRITGWRLVGSMLVYMNRGIGTVGLSLRFNCPPEVTVLTLWGYPERLMRDESGDDA